MELTNQSDQIQVPEEELYQHSNGGPRLCSYCKILMSVNSWSNAKDRRVGNVHLWWIEDSFPGFPQIGMRSTRGCEVCRFLREILVNYDWKEPREGIMYMHLTAGRSWESGTLRYTNMVLWHHMGSVKEKGFFHFDLQSDNDGCRWFRPANSVQPLCAANIENLRTQMNECIQTCHPRKRTSYMPSRLVEVGGKDSTGPCLRIMNRIATLQANVEYAALSYCWGSPTDSERQLKTTKTTLENYMSKIPLDMMSPVMIDAVVTCRKLGIAYLWIDALCILQDDRNDWVKESEEMGNIYANAHITICPLSSTSCQEGFLSRSFAPKIEIPILSSANPSVEGTYEIISRRICHSYGDFSPISHPVYKDLKYSQYRQRGWTLQEEIFSPRKIYFGPYMVHFQCASRTSSENDQNRIHSRLVPTKRKTPLKWHSICNDVLRRSYAFADDLFPSIAGLAKYVKEERNNVNEQYIAGLWESTLCNDLCFFRDERQISQLPPTLESQIHRLQNQSPFIAPSWSWASFKAPTKYLSTSHTEPTYKSLQAHVTTTDSSRYGKVSRGTSLSVSSFLLPCEYDKAASIYRTYILQRPTHWILTLAESRMIVRCIFDWSTGGDATKLPDNAFLLLLRSECTMPSSDGAREERIVHYLNNFDWPRHFEHVPDVATCKYCNDQTLDRHASGLIIYPSGQPNTYYRIGVWFSYVDESGGLKFFKRLPTQEVVLI